MFICLKQAWLGNAAGAKLEVDEDTARHLAAKGVADVLPADDPVNQLVARTIESATAAVGQQLNAAVESALKEFARAQAKSRRHAVPAIFGEEGAGDPERTFGKFLLAVRRGDSKALEEMGSHFAEWGAEGKAALNVGTGGGSQGGYTVPTEFLAQLLSAAAENAIARPRSMVIPMAARSIQVPALDVTTAPTAGDTAFFGGLVARWNEEANTVNETEPAFKQLELVAHELSGYSKVSNQLLADSAVGLEALLIRLFGGAIAWFEDYAFLRGDGVGKPLGAVGGAASHAKSISRANANTFALVDAAKMLGALLPGWDARSTCWCVSPSVIQQVLQLGSTSAAVTFLDSYQEKPKMQLLGLPICVTEKLPALGTAKDVCLIDWKHYLIGDRQQVEIAFSEHVAFLTNQGVWRFVSRVDGQPWLRSTITLSDASTTISPFVYLS